MKNIILIILTFFTLNLFGQTEPADEFRTATGVIKSVKGTNFKKSIKVIGGKNVTVYEQPNTDTYNTFSIVNDSVRIQKWKLDTTTNVFVTSNLNDVYLDNLVNKPSVDSRVVLDIVNDSLKVEVWDIINNTLLSTYYIDNVGNHAETVTTLTNTIPNGNLIGTYTNEAGAVVNIKETLTAYNDQTTSTPHLIGKYLDEFGNLTDINETLTSLNSTLSTGHLIGQYVNEDNVGVTIKESIIGVVNNADGSATITKEDGTTVTTTPYPNTNFVQTNDSLWIHTNLDGTKDTIKVPLPTVNTDTRLQLSVVNDSIKIEVVDVLTNTVTSTSYLDNMVNQPEIITTITDTLVGGHLIANYTNEANVVRGIYESVIQVDSITNGYVITKEDGTKDTIKINPTGFYTLTDISDTLALNAVAVSKCPALTIAKLDSCNRSYLFMYDCNTSSWFIDSINIQEYKDREFLVAQKYKNFTDNTGVADVTNPAYQRQLGSAKMGCDHCPYPSIMDAVIYAQTNSVDTLDVELSAETYKETGVNTNPLFGNFSSFKLNTRNSFLDVSNSNQPLFSVNSDTKNDYTLNIDNLVGINCTHTPYPVFSSRHEGTGTLNLNINNLYFEPTQSTRLFGAFLETKGNLNFSAENVHYKAGSFFLVSNGGEVNWRNISKTYKVKNLELIDAVGLYIRRGQHDTKINVNFENVNHIRTSSPPYVSGTNIGYMNLISKTNGGSYASFNGNNSNVYIRVNNYKRLDTFTQGSGTGAFDLIGLPTSQNSDAVIFWTQFLPEDSLSYFIECDNINTNDEIVYADGNNLFVTPTISNSVIKIIVKNATTKSRAIAIGNFNLINTKIIIEGEFESTNKCVSIYNNILDATSSITLKGKFKTTSPTLEAMEIGNNSGAGVNNIIINGQIITGGGFSIDNPAGTPINVKVMPGCASNVTTSANVTQLGTGIYVDPNFNN
jgi:hypothetical protein